ncbi:hypothetical protein H8356DRAFT_1423292 [Neocallimastix lanati (nom. inval.)]|nr:hypothetical protein H8356DRAFT_1423292 [Neocallimastix sp. JGI-2020a]
MKYFMDIEIPYEKLYRISNYCPISNSNVNIVIIDMNNEESSTDSDSKPSRYYENPTLILSMNHLLRIIFIELLGFRANYLLKRIANKTSNTTIYNIFLKKYKSFAWKIFIIQVHLRLDQIKYKKFKFDELNIDKIFDMRIYMQSKLVSKKIFQHVALVLRNILITILIFFYVLCLLLEGILLIISYKKFTTLSRKLNNRSKERELNNNMYENDKMSMVSLNLSIEERTSRHRKGINFFTKLSLSFLSHFEEEVLRHLLVFKNKIDKEWNEGVKSEESTQMDISLIRPKYMQEILRRKFEMTNATPSGNYMNLHHENQRKLKDPTFRRLTKNIKKNLSLSDAMWTSQVIRRQKGSTTQFIITIEKFTNELVFQAPTLIFEKIIIYFIINTI